MCAAIFSLPLPLSLDTGFSTLAVVNNGAVNMEVQLSDIVISLTLNIYPEVGWLDLVLLLIS